VDSLQKSLKSRTFIIALLLVLALAVLWTFYGISRLGPNAAYGAVGPEMFYGYFVILAFPLLLVVPMLAHSRATSDWMHRNSRTLVRPQERRMLCGQLIGSLAQILIFTSAVAPCLSFCALLRGIDVGGIAWFVAWAIFASLFLSICAFWDAATFPRKRRRVVSLLMAIALCAVFLSASRGAHLLLAGGGVPLESIDFWTNNLAAFLALSTTFALIYFAAAGQLLSPAQRTSTALRIVMLLQQTLLAAWAGAAYFHAIHSYSLHVNRIIEYFAEISMIYWFVMGVAMLGESTALPQPGRSTPRQSLLGLALFRLFGSGPATGFMFSIGSAAAAALLSLAAVFIWLAEWRQPYPPWFEPLVSFVVLAFGYLVIYLGLASAVLWVMRRATTVGLRGVVLVDAVLLGIGIGLPALIENLILNRAGGYSLWRVTDPFRTCATVFDFPAPNYLTAPLWIVGIVALSILAVNLFLLAPQIARPAPRSID
jgi:hypothetical protein